MMMLNKVKLANGSEVTWEEFTKWSNKKQIANLQPNRKGKKHTQASLNKRKETWLSKDRSLTEEHKDKLRAIKRSEEFKENLRVPLTEERKSKLRGRKLSEETKNKLRGRKLSEEILAKRKATRAVTLMWHTPNGTFPNKMAIYLKVRSDMKIPHLKAIELVESWIRDFPHLYYRNTKN
jgi:hypothetical protein